MNQQIVKDAQNVVLQKKLKSENEYKEKTKILYGDKNYVKTEKALTNLIIENAKKEAYNEKPDIEQEENLKKILHELKKKYNLEDEVIQYSCEICKDEGYKNSEACVCLKKEISNILLKQSGFSFLVDFKDSIKSSGDLSGFYTLMKQWCHSDFKKDLVFISGPIGVGKTYLLRSMANELIERGKIVKITSAPDMNLDFRDFMKSSDNELIKKYIDCEVLFIDDLGTETIFKNITIQNLYLVLNSRKIRRLPTIITSNLNIDDIRNQYDERIFSRIVDRQTSITIFLDGEDKRLKNNK